MAQTTFDITDTPAKGRGVMVCVTGQRSCEKLIMRGAKRSVEGAGEPGIEGGRAPAPLPLYVVHCVQTGQNFMNTPYEADAIDYLFTCAQVVGAELTILRADSVEDALVDFAHKNGVAIMVTGSSSESDRRGGRFVRKLMERLPEVEFDIVGC